jgi:hypothetical protein
MSIKEILDGLGRPVAYGFHSEDQQLPYFCIMGAGQDQVRADNTYYVTEDRYQVEYYYKKKNPEFEKQIETLLLEHGFLYYKSEDVYLDDQDVFVIYYDI